MDGILTWLSEKLCPYHIRDGRPRFLSAKIMAGFSAFISSRMALSIISVSLISMESSFVSVDSLRLDIVSAVVFFECLRLCADVEFMVPKHNKMAAAVFRMNLYVVGNVCIAGSLYY